MALLTLLIITPVAARRLGSTRDSEVAEEKTLLKSPLNIIPYGSSRTFLGSGTGVFFYNLEA